MTTPAGRAPTRHIREYAGDKEAGLLRSVPMDASEATFQAAVVRYAKFHGWEVYHTHDSRHSAAGFPDLVGNHPSKGMFAAELKKTGGQATSAQTRWLVAFKAAGTPSYLWWPKDLAEIEEVLRG